MNIVYLTFVDHFITLLPYQYIIYFIYLILHSLFCSLYVSVGLVSDSEIDAICQTIWSASQRDTFRQALGITIILEESRHLLNNDDLKEDLKLWRDMNGDVSECWERRKLLNDTLTLIGVPSKLDFIRKHIIERVHIIGRLRQGTYHW